MCIGKRPSPHLTVRKIADAWPSIAAFARDLGAPYETAKAWARNGRIPPAWHNRVIAAARRRGLRGVTLALLISHHGPQKATGPRRG